MHETQQLPLTGAQAGIWFAQRLDPDNPIYNTGEYVEINGTIDVNIFKTAVERVLTEAASLHARFTEGTDGPRQIINPSCEVAIDVMDVSAEPDPMQAALRIMQSDLAEPVDMAAGPLFRDILFEAGPERFFWYQRIHHIAIDGYGFSLLARRTAQLYTAIREGRPDNGRSFGSLEELVKEDQEYRASDQFLKDREFWMEKFADEPDVVSLAERAPRTSTSFRRSTAYLSETVLQHVKAIPNWHEAVTAAVAIYVHRMTNAGDIVLGLPMMGRIGSISLNIPSMTMNLLPLRLSLRPDMNVHETVSQVAKEIRSIRRHQKYRHEDLRRDLKLLGENRRLFGPQVNVMPFDYALDFAGVPGTVHNLSAGPVDDLSINVYDRADGRGLRVDFDANPEVYSAEDIENHQKRFLLPLESALKDQTQKIGRLNLLLENERLRVLESWNDTRKAEKQKSLPELFHDQAAKTPDSPAIITENGELSYAELNRRANQLARMLKKKGLGPEQFAALLLPRSQELVVSMLAVLKTGAAYLPLDPDFPSERITYMLKDAQPACLITTMELSGRMPEESDAQTIILDHPDTVKTVAGQNADCPAHMEYSPMHPAYIIYTSGSTGRPKGVVVTLKSVSNFLLSMWEMFPLGAQDRLLAVTTACV